MSTKNEQMIEYPIKIAANCMLALIITAPVFSFMQYKTELLIKSLADLCRPVGFVRRV